MTESEEEVIEGLRNIVKTQIGSFAVPEILLVSMELWTTTVIAKMLYVLQSSIVINTPSGFGWGVNVLSEVQSGTILY